MRTLIISLAAAAALALPAGPGAAQQLLSSDKGYITIIQPQEWTGTGTRGPTGIVFTGRPVRVRGKAHHPSGIARVTLNGAAASIQQDAAGATVFTGVIPGPAAARDVQIVAYPVTGEPIVRMQKPDGTWRYTALAPAALPAQGGVTGEARLRVSTGALSRAERDALVGALHGEPRIALDAGAGAHLSIRREGAEYVVAGPDGAVRHHVPAGGTNAAAPLLPLLVQEYGALQLAELPAPTNAVPLDFAFPNGSDFRLGQGIEFRVRSARDGYLTVVDLGTNGAIGVLYPTPADESEVRAGQELRLPSEAARALYTPDPPYQAGEPLGTGVVRAFVTPRPLVLPETATGAVSADAFLRALREAAGTQPWGTAALTYRITAP